MVYSEALSFSPDEVSLFNGESVRVIEDTYGSGKNGYTKRILKSDSGETITEYLTNDNICFAVGWKGMRIPDLKLLFGSVMYDEYVEARTMIRKKVRNEEVDGTDLSVWTGGHMRHVLGRAWIPLSTPKGFSW